MVVGTDVVNAGRNSLFGFVSTYNQHLSQHYSQVIEHEMFKDLIKKEGKEKQELKLAESRAMIMGEQMVKALGESQKENNGRLSAQILIYRDGVGGPTMEPKVIENEIPFV